MPSSGIYCIQYFLPQKCIPHFWKFYHRPQVGMALVFLRVFFRRFEGLWKLFFNRAGRYRILLTAVYQFSLSTAYHTKFLGPRPPLLEVLCLSSWFCTASENLNCEPKQTKKQPGLQWVKIKRKENFELPIASYSKNHEQPKFLEPCTALSPKL